jgi:hypothetical protein
MSRRRDFFREILDHNVAAGFAVGFVSALGFGFEGGAEQSDAFFVPGEEG